jgi:ankyrin repeat protein
MVDLLLNFVDVPSTENSCEHLMAAVETGRRDIVQLILDDADISDNACAEVLHEACSKGFLDIVELLVSRHPNMQQGGPLRNACIPGHPQIARHLLNQGAATELDDREYRNFFEIVLQNWAEDYDAVSEQDKNSILTMLMQSGIDALYCRYAPVVGTGGTVAFLKHLLEAGPMNEYDDQWYDDNEDYDDEDEDEEADASPAGGYDGLFGDYGSEHGMAPALYAACEHARMDIIRFMYPVVTRKRRGVSRRKMTKAAALGGPAVFELVLELLKIDVNDPGTCYDRDDVLLQAVRSGSVGAVTALLGHPGCDINKVYDMEFFKDGSKELVAPGTLLAAASDPATIAVLLEHRADVNPRGCVSVLATAVQRFRPAAVEALLAAGARVEPDDGTPGADTPKIKTVFEIFLFFSGQLDWESNLRDDQREPVLKLLLEAGMQTREFDLDSIKSLPLVRALATHDPGLLAATNEWGNTPLTSSIISSKHDRTKLLLELGADPTVSSRQRRNALLLLWRACIRSDGDSWLEPNWDDDVSEVIACMCDAILRRNSSTSVGGAGATSEGDGGDAGRRRERERARKRHRREWSLQLMFEREREMNE